MVKKYFWLKLKEDFFDNEDVKLIEAMPNGKDYIIFYLKLQLKALKYEGILKYKSLIPYTDEMLATITNTNIDIIKSSIKLFKELKMIEIWEDGTLYMNELQLLIGSETEIAKRVRKHRTEKKNNEKKMLQEKKLITNQISIDADSGVLQCNTDVTKCNTEKEKEIELNKDLNKDLNRKIKKQKKENIYLEIYDYYQTKENLPKDDGFTKTIKAAITKCMRDANLKVEEIKVLIDRHNTIVGLTKNNGKYQILGRSLCKFLGQKSHLGTNLICEEYKDNGDKYIKHIKNAQPQMTEAEQSEYEQNQILENFKKSKEKK